MNDSTGQTGNTGAGRRVPLGRVLPLSARARPALSRARSFEKNVRSTGRTIAAGQVGVSPRVGLALLSILGMVCGACGHWANIWAFTGLPHYHRLTLRGRRVPPDEASPDEYVTVCPECGATESFDEVRCPALAELLRKGMP